MKPASFPKVCSCGASYPSRTTWERLPAASGGLLAMGLEWRNCQGATAKGVCNSTLVVAA